MRTPSLPALPITERWLDVRFIAVAVPICVLVGLASSAVVDVGPFYLVAAASILTATTVGVLVWQHRLRHDALSPLGLVAAFYVFAFMAGGLYFWSGSVTFFGIFTPFEHGDLIASMFIAAAAFALVVLGYVANPLRLLLVAIPPVPSAPQVRSRARLLFFVLTVGWTARLYTFASGTYFHIHEARAAGGGSWVIDAATHLPTVGAAFVGAQAYFRRASGDRSRALERGFYGLLLIEFLWYVPSGSRAALLSVAMMVVVVRYYALGRLPAWWSAILGAALAMLIVFPLISTYRNTSTAAGGYQNNPTGSLQVALGNLFSQSPHEAWQTGFDATFSRFSDVTSMAVVLHGGRGPWARKPGETLGWSLTTFLPRAIAPNKPQPAVIGNEFGRNYRITAPNDFSTSIALPQFTEFYLNYGFFGIVVGMILVGGIYRLMGDYFIGRKDDPVVLAVYSVAAWDIINGQESIVASGLIGVLKFMLLLVVVVAVLNRLQTLRVRA